MGTMGLVVAWGFLSAKFSRVGFAINTQIIGSEAPKSLLSRVLRAATKYMGGALCHLSTGVQDALLVL